MLNIVQGKITMHYSDLVGRMVTLRPLQHSYIDDYLLMFSPLVRKALQVTALDSERTYLNEQIEQMKQGRYPFYVIFDNQDQKLIGAIAIRDVYKGQLYSWLNEAYWGQGRYQEALQLIAQSYFKLTQEHFFTARVDVSNRRSYAALKKAGFADTGISEGPFGKQYELIYRKKATPHEQVA